MKIPSSRLAFFFALIFLLPSAQCAYSEMEPVDNALGVTAVMDSIGLMTASLFLVGDPAPVAISLSAKMFVYIKYMDVLYSEDLMTRFTAQRTTSVFFDFRFDMSDATRAPFTKSPPPDAFARYSMKPNFIINFWPGFITLIMVCGMLFVIIGFHWLAENTTFRILKPATLYQMRVSMQNFCWLVFYNAYPDIVLYSMVDFRSTKVQSGRDAFSFCVALIFLVGGGILIYKHAKILLKHRQLLKKTGELAAKELQAFYKETETIQILHKGFKKTSFAKQFCLLILTARAVLSSFIIAMLYTSPIGECLLIMAIDIAIFIYFIKATPFEDKYQRYLQITSEVLYATIILCVFVNASMDGYQDTDAEGRKHLARYVIVVNIFYNFLILFFVCWKIFQATKEAFAIKPQTSPMMRPSTSPSLVPLEFIARDTVRKPSPSDRLKPRITIETAQTASSPNNMDSYSGNYNFDKPTIKPEAVKNDESFNSSNLSLLGRRGDSELVSPTLQPDFIRGASMHTPSSATLNVDYGKGVSLYGPSIKAKMSSFYHSSERNTPRNQNQNQDYNYMIKKNLSPKFDPLNKNMSYFSKAMKHENDESIASSMQVDQPGLKKLNSANDYKSSDYDKSGNASFRRSLEFDQVQLDQNLKIGGGSRVLREFETKKIEQNSRIGNLSHRTDLSDFDIPQRGKTRINTDYKSPEFGPRRDMKITIGSNRMSLEAGQMEQLKLGNGTNRNLSEFDTTQMEQDMKLGNGSNVILSPSYSPPHMTPNYTPNGNANLTPTYVESVLFGKHKEDPPMKKPKRKIY